MPKHVADALEHADRNAGEVAFDLTEVADGDACRRGELFQGQALGLAEPADLLADLCGRVELGARGGLVELAGCVQGSERHPGQTFTRRLFGS